MFLFAIIGSVGGVNAWPKKLIRTFVNHYFVIGKKENFHKIIPVFHLEKKELLENS